MNYHKIIDNARPNVPKLKAPPALADIDRKITNIQEQRQRALAAAEAAADSLNALEADIEQLEREALESGGTVDNGRLTRLKAEAAADREKAQDANRRAGVAADMLTQYAAQREEAERSACAAQLEDMRKHCGPAVDRISKALREILNARVDLMERVAGCLEASGRPLESFTDIALRNYLEDLAGEGTVTLFDAPTWEPDITRIPSDISVMEQAAELLTAHR